MSGLVARKWYQERFTQREPFSHLEPSPQPLPRWFSRRKSVPWVGIRKITLKMRCLGAHNSRRPPLQRNEVKPIWVMAINCKAGTRDPISFRTRLKPLVSGPLYTFKNYWGPQRDCLGGTYLDTLFFSIRNLTGDHLKMYLLNHLIDNQPMMCAEITYFLSEITIFQQQQQKKKYIYIGRRVELFYFFLFSCKFLYAQLIRGSLASETGEEKDKHQQGNRVKVPFSTTTGQPKVSLSRA